MGVPSDSTFVLMVGDGLAGDVDLARWASIGPSYGEAPAEDLAAIVPSLADLETVQPFGGLAFLASSGVPLVAANLRAEGGDATLAPYRAVEYAGGRVALLGLAQPGEWPGAQVISPVQALRPLRSKLNRKTRIVILLSNAGIEADRQLAGEAQWVDVIVGGGEDPLDQPERVGDVLLARPGYPGRAVGVLLLTFDGDGRLKQHSWERVMYIPQG